MKRFTTHSVLLVAAILTLHAALLAYSAARHSPTIHEVAHLPAGICHWQYGMFELYRVNPPLPRMLAALPVIFCHPKTDWGNYQLDPLSRETTPMGIRFAKANGARTVFLFTLARWACIPFCLLGAWVCYRWACDLWGPQAGLLALCIWCFDPMILGHGAVVMPDVPAAAVGVLAAWRFWKWLREPTWSATICSGITLGLAELCKTTLLLFFLLWPVALLIKAICVDKRAGVARRVFQLLAIIILGIYVINLGYGFKGSFTRLGDYRFQSSLLTGKRSTDPPTVGNRFNDGWLGWLHLPLPRDYVQGFDRQKTDFEVGEPSYFYGHWEPHGWWYYYVVGLPIKSPIGTLAIALVAMVVTFAGIVRVLRAAAFHLASSAGCEEGNLIQQSSLPVKAASFDELFLLAPAIAILLLVSSQTGFSNHLRYAIPALPYLFIWCAKLLAVSHCTESGCPLRRSLGGVLAGSKVAVIAWVCITAAAIESLSVFPHSISFFNFLVGGPKHGHKWLLGSNGAWGQDLLYLKEWVDNHPEARPLRLATVGWLSPADLGVEYTIPPVGPSCSVTVSDLARVLRCHQAPFGEDSSIADTTVSRPGSLPYPQNSGRNAEAGPTPIPQSWDDVDSLDALGPQPGWYIIDVNFLHGAAWPATRPNWLFQKIAEEDVNYTYFGRFKPCEWIGFSYFVYHLTNDDANRARRDLGLPPLAQSGAVWHSSDPAGKDREQ